MPKARRKKTNGKIRIEYMPLDELMRWPGNPKDHDEEGIGASMDRFGYTNPMLIDERSKRLVGGHGRLDRLEAKRAAGEKPPDRIVARPDGMWLVPVSRGVSFKSDAEAEAYLVADNRLVEKGGWKPEELALMARNIVDLTELGLEGTGFTDDELRDLLDEQHWPAIGPDAGGAKPPVAPVRPGKVKHKSKWEVVHADCLEHLKTLDDASVDAVVTDPPYEMGFMGRDWDSAGITYKVELWREVLRVLKPGGHLVAFGGTRTHHRLTVAIEDAGFEIRDCLQWVTGQGFPKPHDISKAIDREAGADAAAEWEGWGSNLKPSWEPIILARRPFEGTVAECVQRWSTGGLNIDGCRIDTPDRWNASGVQSEPSLVLQGGADGSLNVSVSSTHEAGRWPANTILQHHPECIETEKVDDDDVRIWDCQPDCPVRMLDAQSSDAGGASRFFYTAKSSRREREEGLEHTQDLHSKSGRVNIHTTVKPIALMRWLVRLITPHGGTVLDPFAGSGSTGIAAVWENSDFIGIELNDTEAEPYVTIARARIDHASRVDVPDLDVP